MKQKVEVLFYLKKKEQDKDGKCPIMGRITVGKTIAAFSTKLKIEPSAWDGTAKRAAGKNHEAKAINKRLNIFITSILASYKELVEIHNQVTAEQVRVAFQGIVSEQATIIHYFETYNKKYQERIGKDRVQGSMDMLKQGLNHLRAFMMKKYKADDMPFSSLKFAFIEDYEFYLLIDLGLMPRTVSRIITTMHRMVRLAIGDGIIPQDPFTGYALPHKEMKHRYLTKQELSLLMNAPLKKDKQRLIRDLFLVQCFTGMAYRELYNLTEENLVTADDGRMWIKIQRQKTGGDCRIPLMDIPLSIIRRYKGTAGDDKLLPVPDMEAMNYGLQAIGKQCGITKHLTTHVGRHTYASEVTLSQGVPIESVAKMLGHRRLSSTRVYARITEEREERDGNLLRKKIDGKYKMTWL
jgi:site-specific recombinase XerD